MDILENPEYLREMAKSLNLLTRGNPNWHYYIGCCMGGRQMRMEQINICGSIEYYLTPAELSFYSKEFQHVRKKGSPYAVYKLDELIEMMEKRNFEIK